MLSLLFDYIIYEECKLLCMLVVVSIDEALIHFSSFPTSNMGFTSHRFVYRILLCYFIDRDVTGVVPWPVLEVAVLQHQRQMVWQATHQTRATTMVWMMAQL
jgi:hypothetical protein